MKICKVCLESFISSHFSQLCCGDLCKKKNSDRIKRKSYDKLVVPTFKGRKPKMTDEERAAKTKAANNTPERKAYMKEYRKPEERRVKERASGREYKGKNPDKQKNGHLKRTFGITLEDFNKMMFNQNGVCEICKNAETKVFKKTGKVTDLCVDHCHKTGKVRGLLCWDCNTSLGKMKESIKALESAIEYLKRNQ